MGKTWATNIARGMLEMQNKLYGGFDGVTVLKNERAMLTYAVLPCILDMCMSFEGSSGYAPSTERPCTHDYMKTGKWGDGGADKLPHVPNYVMQAQLMKIAMDRSMPILHRIATACQYFVFLNPEAVAKSIKLRVPMGLSVDFFRLQSFNSDTVLVGKPFSHDMIVTGGEADIKKQTDGRLKISLGCKIQTASNMVAGGAIVASMANPLPKPSSLACGPKNEPVISVDYITRSQGSTLSALTKDSTILRTLALSDERRRLIQNKISAGTCSEEDEFVGIIRPVSDPTHAPLPYMGKPIYEGISTPGVGNEEPPLVKFTSRASATRNPYMSALDSIYQMLYSPRSSNMGSSEDAFRRKTFCEALNNPRPVSMTTQVLETAMSMDWTLDNRLFSPTESGAFTNYCATKAQLNDMKLSSVPTNGSSDRAAGLMGVATRNGYSVPYTQWTCRKLRESAEEGRRFQSSGYTKRGELSSSHLIMSPFSVPNEFGDSGIIGY